MPNGLPSTLHYYKNNDMPDGLAKEIRAGLERIRPHVRGIVEYGTPEESSLIYREEGKPVHFDGPYEIIKGLNKLIERAEEESQ